MALVNTAYVLAREGWRVLLVDFDLEAPGMTHFFARDVRRRPAHVRKDSLDLLWDAKLSLAAADQHHERSGYPRSLAEYVVPLSLPAAWQEEAPKGIPYRNGRLDLIPARLEPRQTGESLSEEPPLDYLERLSDLDLASLFQAGGPGHRFGDHVRKHFVSARFEAPGDVLFALRDPVEAAYDMVLIDSRTGLNEIAGFSIGTVADALVICCGLNQQNIEGTRYFMKKTGLFDRKKAKPFLIAVGPIPPWLVPEVEQRLQVLRRALHLEQDTRRSFEDLLDGRETEKSEEGSLEIAYDFPELVGIPFHSLAALRETVFVTELPEDPIAKSYVRLAERIQSKLAPGALEAADWHIRELHLSRNSGPETLRNFSEFAAVRLPHLRVQRGRGAQVPVFPTIWCVRALPEHRDEVEWEDLGRISIAAAVSALQLRSAEPFERAWAWLSTLKREGFQRFLARRLLFFQSSTQYPLPENPLAWLQLQAEGDLDDAQRELSDHCSLMAARRLASYRPERFRGESAETGFPVWYSLHDYEGGREPGSLTTAEKRLLLSRAVELMVDGTLRDDADAMRFLQGFYQLPASPEKVLGGEFPPGSTPDPASAYEKTPAGFWPEPLAATALAAAGGAEAVEEILAWLHLAHLRYGYAWRVLLDWRYFDEVKQHPRFQDFVREEDEIVAAIEERIDRGEFPL
jgi:cellulose biosynthesis protein BcsQ